MDHKILVCYTTFLSKFVYSNLQPFQMRNPLVRVFSIDSNLLLWNSLFNFSRDETVCRANLLTSLSHATLKFPSRKSSFFTFFTNLNATFQMEKLVLIERIRSSYANSFNSTNFMIFIKVHISLHCILVLILSRNHNWHGCIFYPSTFHTNEISLGFLSQNVNTMNTVFFCWHFLEKNNC